MKNICIFIFSLLCLIIVIKPVYSQNTGENCVGAAPFCTGIIYDFPMSDTTMGEMGPNYGCLHTYPNPVWYYLKIAQAGNITIHIAGSDGSIGRDVDFICWGPFNSIASVCTDSLYGACAWGQCPNNTTSPNFYPTYSAPNIIDCSYDASPTENCHILNAQHGKYYLLCITNYSDQPGMLTFSKLSGTATTDCSIVYNKALFDIPNGCESEPMHFADSSTIVDPITGRLWDFGDGQTDTAASPNHTYTAAGKYLVRLTIFVNEDTYSVAHYVIVNKLAASIVPTSPINICLGDTVDLSAIVTTYPQTYLKQEFKEITNENIPNTGIDTLLWHGGLPNDPFFNTLYLADTINVSGINAGWTINSIGVNIEHTVVNDVIVYIKAPGGNFVQLIQSCHGSDPDFKDTYLVPPPLATKNVKSGLPPFSGSWIPSGGPGIWTSLTGFVNPNGPWVITVADGDNQNASGKLLDWSIEFNNPKLTQYSFNWLDPINDSIHLIQKVSPTDTTTYTINAVNEYGCTSTSEVTVNIVPDPVVIIRKDTTICKGDTATLVASGAYTYSWMPGNLTGTEIKVAPDDTTTYTIIGTNDIGCVSDPTTTTVNVTTGPKIILPRDTTMYPEQNLVLTASGAATYYWTPVNLNGASITVSPKVETDYYVYGSDPRGCTTIDTITVKIDFGYNIFIPNTFSPNGDSQNDILYVRSYGIKEIEEFQIYDRLGEMVFSSNTKEKGWDGTYKGKLLNPGVFAYFLKAKTYDNKIVEKKGNITLIK